MRSWLQVRDEDEDREDGLLNLDFTMGLNNSLEIPMVL
jgi:hypothetical protein